MKQPFINYNCLKEKSNTINREEHIVRLCKKGKEEGFKALYEDFGPVLLTISCRYARDRQEGEDILQEALIKVFRKINSFRENGSFEGWLKRVVVTTALNKVKKNGRLKEDEMPENIESTFDPDQKNIDNEYLIMCLHRLPEGYRTVFNMYVIDGYTHKEIAKLLGISEGTSKSQYSKARAALRGIVNYKQLLNQ